MEKIKSPLLKNTASVIYSVALFFFIITFSISLPIYCRFFYFAHIKPLNLPQISGYSHNQIKEAYNDVLDFLTLPNKEFSCGDMSFSSEGAAHFEDCKFLFTLNFVVLFCSAVILIILNILKKFKIFKEYAFKKHKSCFYSAVCAVALPILIVIPAVFNFEKVFTVFHLILFPGKSNWVFDPYKDEIINVMPINFFINCAILIGVSILVFSALLIWQDKKYNKKK